MKRSSKSKGKIWVAFVELSYEVVGAGETEREATAAATKLAATWLNQRGGEQPLGRWTAAKVEEYFGTRTYHVPIGGATLP